MKLRICSVEIIVASCNPDVQTRVNNCWRQIVGCLKERPCCSIHYVASYSQIKCGQNKLMRPAADSVDLLNCSHVMFMSGDAWNSGGIDHTGVCLFISLKAPLLFKVMETALNVNRPTI